MRVSLCVYIYRNGRNNEEAKRMKRMESEGFDKRTIKRRQVFDPIDWSKFSIECHHPHSFSFALGEVGLQAKMKNEKLHHQSRKQLA